MNSLLVRADGNNQIGIGHVMRCLALAQAWQENGGEVHFVIDEGSIALESRLQDEGVNLYTISGVSGSASDENQTLAFADAINASWIVVDGYQFDTVYQKTLKQAGKQLLFVDDYGHADVYYADQLLNQNVYAARELYQNRADLTRLLLGTRYALLRREFWHWRKWQRNITHEARKILVTLGGSDPDNVALEVIQALRMLNIANLEVAVVVGSSNPHGQTLHETIEDRQDSFRLEQNVADMPALMAWADVAVSAGGSTCWELAFMGLPTIIITLAKNQEAVGPGLERVGAAISLGWHNDLTIQKIAETIDSLLRDFSKRVEISQNGKALVDGFGAPRVVQHMQLGGLNLRDIVAGDVRLLWEWANDPITRAASFSSTPIPWGSHADWFDQKLKDEKCLFFIAFDHNSRNL